MRVSRDGECKQGRCLPYRKCVPGRGSVVRGSGGVFCSQLLLMRKME